MLKKGTYQPGPVLTPPRGIDTGLNTKGVLVKLITREADYAIRAICCIARTEKKVVPVSDLEKKLKVPRPFLRKILQILTRKGILRSFKGKGGGFTLAVASKDISVLELLEAFQGPFCISEHKFRQKTCPQIKKCKLKKRLDSIEKNMIGELKNIKISYLI
ncbi:MAG: Rrf2 family transcriptional regulator [Candidatus Omnitrophota bacterium]